MSKRYCDGCGQEIPNGEPFCPVCGGAVFGENLVEPQKKKPFPVRWVLVGAGVLAAALVTVLLLAGGKEPPKQTEPPQLSTQPSQTQPTVTDPKPSTTEPTDPEPSETDPTDPGLMDGPTVEELNQYLTAPEPYVPIVYKGQEFVTDPDMKKALKGCEESHLYIYNKETKEVQDASLEYVSKALATRDYLYYALASVDVVEHDSVYRVKWDLSEKELVFRVSDHYANIQGLDYHGSDPEGFLYVSINTILNGKMVDVIYKVDLKTGNEREIMQQSEIHSFDVHMGNDYCIDSDGNYLVNVIYWTGYQSAGTGYWDGYYCLDTKEMHPVRNRTPDLPENPFEGPASALLYGYVQPPETLRLSQLFTPYLDPEIYGYYLHLYVIRGGEEPGTDVCGEPVETYFATKDYIYYVKKSDPTKVYRTDWALTDHELIYTSEAGNLDYMTYIGIDPMGKIYAVVDEKQIVEYDLATGTERVIMEQHNISRAEVYVGNRYMTDRFENKFYNVIYWSGTLLDGRHFGGVYFLDTGELIDKVRPSY